MASARLQLWHALQDLQEGPNNPRRNETLRMLIGNRHLATSSRAMSNHTTSAAIDTLPILIAPNPILKARARPVTSTDDDILRDLIPRMFATMYQAPGIGLAAPQVSQGVRVIVIDVMPNDKNQPLSLINPEVVAASEEYATREEGCLSLPGQYAEIARPARVKVRYLDQTGSKRELEAEGLLAACVQHEIDHLNGILFVDHLSALKRNMIMRRLAKEQRVRQDERSR